MTDNEDLRAEIRALLRRKALLKRVCELRQEVGLLQSAFIGDETKNVLKIIAEEVCRIFDTNFERITSVSRAAAVSIPRMVIFYLSRELKQIPYHHTGRCFRKDHGTVMHGRNRIKDRMTTEPNFAQLVAEIKRACEMRLSQEKEAHAS